MELHFFSDDMENPSKTGRLLELRGGFIKVDQFILLNANSKKLEDIFSSIFLKKQRLWTVHSGDGQWWIWGLQGLRGRVQSIDC